MLQAARSHAAGEMPEYELALGASAYGMRVLESGRGFCGPSIYFASKRTLHIDAVTISKVRVNMPRRGNPDSRLLAHKVGRIEPGNVPQCNRGSL